MGTFYDAETAPAEGVGDEGDGDGEEVGTDLTVVVGVGEEVVVLGGGAKDGRSEATSGRLLVISLDVASLRSSFFLPPRL